MGLVVERIYIYLNIFGTWYVAILEQDCCGSSVSLLGMFVLSDLDSGGTNPSPNPSTNPSDPSGNNNGTLDPNLPISIFPSSPIVPVILPPGYSLNDPNNTYYNSGPNANWSGINLSTFPNELGPNDAIFDMGNAAFGIDINKMFKCFDNIPDAGATFTVKACVDIPNNNDPTVLWNLSNRAGHVFLTLSKSNGSQTITQSIGFYWKIR